MHVQNFWCWFNSLSRIWWIKSFVLIFWETSDSVSSVSNSFTSLCCFSLLLYSIDIFKGVLVLLPIGSNWQTNRTEGVNLAETLWLMVRTLPGSPCWALSDGSWRSWRRPARRSAASLSPPAVSSEPTADLLSDSPERQEETRLYPLISFNSKLFKHRTSFTLRLLSVHVGCRAGTETWHEPEPSDLQWVRLLHLLIMNAIIRINI